MNCPHCKKELDKQWVAKELGSMGGQTNVKKHGKKHMSEIGKKGMEARWGKKDEDR